jgi:ribosome maturation factor RimP
MRQNATREQLTGRIEEILAVGFPDVEVVDVALRGGRSARVTVYIDAPGGVDLDLCAAVTRGLDELRDEFTLEVSSPGLDRPLRKPAHYRDAIGRRAEVRTAAPKDGRSSFRGRVTAADDERVTLVLDDHIDIAIAYADIARAHVIYEFAQNGGHRE